MSSTNGPSVGLQITCSGKQGPIPDGSASIPCIACENLILPGQYFTSVPVGCGADPSARANARRKLPFRVVFRHVHWACFLGDESESSLSIV